MYVEVCLRTSTFKTSSKRVGSDLKISRARLKLACAVVGALLVNMGDDIELQQKLQISFFEDVEQTVPQLTLEEQTLLQSVSFADLFPTHGKHSRNAKRQRRNKNGTFASAWIPVSHFYL